MRQASLDHYEVVLLLAMSGLFRGMARKIQDNQDIYRYIRAIHKHHKLTNALRLCSDLRLFCNASKKLQLSDSKQVFRNSNNLDGKTTWKQLGNHGAGPSNPRLEETGAEPTDSRCSRVPKLPRSS